MAKKIRAREIIFFHILYTLYTFCVVNQRAAGNGIVNCRNFREDKSKGQESIFCCMPPPPPSRKSRSVVTPSSSKRQRKSDDPLQPSVSPTPVVIVSKEVAAAKRLQRVWRSTFKHLLTKTYAMRFLDPEFGVPIEKVKSIRYEFAFPSISLPLLFINFYLLTSLSIPSASKPSSSSSARSPSSPSPRPASSASTSSRPSAMAPLPAL